MENLENLDSQECIFLHSGKKIILCSSLLIYPVYNKIISCAPQQFFDSSTVINNKNSNQVSYDHRSYKRKLSNCVKKPEKVRTSTGFEPVTSRYRCDTLTN